MTVSPVNRFGEWATFAAMNKRVNSIAFGASAVQPATGDADGWVMVMPAGTFTGRDGRGPFTAGDKAAMQKIIDRTLAHFGGTEVMIDYDHHWFFAARPGVGGTGRAAGWIKQFEAREDGIYGRREWTPAAKARIEAGEYRYLSPLFTSSKATGQVGRIESVALINTPNLDLTAFAARADELSPEEDEDMKTIAKALGLEDSAGEAAILAAITAFSAGLGKVAAAVGLKAGAKPDDIVTAVTAFAADRGKIAVAAGLKADAKTDEIVTAMSAKAGDVDASQFVPMSMFTELQGQMKTLQETGASEKADQAVAEAMSAGKITPANKDWALNYFKKDPAGFNAFVGNAPRLTGQQLAKTPPEAGKPALTDADEQVMAAMGISREAYVASKQSLETA